jgi:hypothetical protein
LVFFSFLTNTIVLLPHRVHGLVVAPTFTTLGLC